MPQQYPLYHQQQQQQQQQPQQPAYMPDPYTSNDSAPPAAYSSPRAPPMNGYSQFPSFAGGPSPPQAPPALQSSSSFSSRNDPHANGTDFQRFYGPVCEWNVFLSLSLALTITVIDNFIGDSSSDRVERQIEGGHERIFYLH